jgi:hypothetical protein
VFILKEDKLGEMSREVIRSKGAAQECDCDFVSSGDTVIDPQLLMFYKESYVQDPLKKVDLMEIFGMGISNIIKSYMVVADVARGDGSDYSAAHVIDVVNATQVAEYRGKLIPKILETS